MIYKFSDSGAYSDHVAAKREQKMREITRAAFELACESGADSLTLHSLAKRMGRSVAAVYRYFPSKEAVIRELQRLVGTHLLVLTDDALARFAPVAEREGLDEGERALAAALLFGEAYVAYARHAPREFGLITMYLSAVDYRLPEQDAALTFDVARRNLTALARRLDDAAGCGALAPGDAAERAVIFWASLQGVLQAQKLARSAPDFFSPDGLTDQVMAAVLAGWGADAPSVHRLQKLIRTAAVADPRKEAADLLAEPEEEEVASAAD